MRCERLQGDHAYRPRSMCAALATTENGKYVGAASRNDREAARLAALANCNKGNAGECAVRFTECNR